MNLIERNRRSLDASPRWRRWSSPDLAGLDGTLIRKLRERARGDLLDVGCGSMPYRTLVAGQVGSYDGLDVEARSTDVRYVASATDMAPIAAESYDTVLCSEVLEHVDQPWLAVAEIARVLRPGGTLILSVPFLSRLHEEPNDYYRYTRHGLRSLLDATGLQVLEVEPTGSIASFLGHQVSTVLVGATWHLPIVKWVAYAVNLVVVVAPARLIDRALGPLRDKAPAGYVVVASQPGAQG